jgi:uncharacterized protein YbjT (DUF2867 family)
MILVTTAGKVGSAGDGRIGHIDVGDVAAVAAEISVSPAGHAGKTYWPTGPESLSGKDVAEIFTMCHRFSADRPAHSSSSPWTTPTRSHH